MVKKFKKFTRRELARLAKTAPEYLSACRTGKAQPSLGFIIRVMEAVPGELSVEEISPKIAELLDRIKDLETQHG